MSERQLTVRGAAGGGALQQIHLRVLCRCFGKANAEADQSHRLPGASERFIQKRPKVWQCRNKASALGSGSREIAEFQFHEYFCDIAG
jgi:hypothetical protein